jgi:hypothetical protein
LLKSNTYPYLSDFIHFNNAWRTYNRSFEIIIYAEI